VDELLEEECAMRMLKRFLPSPALMVAVAALVVALGGVAYATIPDSGGVIHGCYLNAVGTLRVIDTGTGQHCNTTFEKTIQWNQTGPQGPAGPAGPKGDTGAAGPAGAPGSDQLYFAQASGEVSLTEQPSSSGAYVADLGGPSATVNVSANSLVRFHVSVDAQTSADQFGNRAGVFAYVVDSGGDIPLGTVGVGRTPDDDNFHTYTTGWNEFPATGGQHTYTLEYEEVPVLGIGGQTGPFPPAEFQNRKLWVEVISPTSSSGS
jgi:hypothetical protein